MASNVELAREQIARRIIEVEREREQIARAVDRLERATSEHEQRPSGHHRGDHRTIRQGSGTSGPHLP